MEFKGSRQEPRMADKILARIDQTICGTGSIQEYENGRENGYVLTDDATGVSVTFSENRNSDDAAVYLCDWNNCAEGDQETACKAKKIFRTAREAGDFVVDHFIAARRAKESSAPESCR